MARPGYTSLMLRAEDRAHLDVIAHYRGLDVTKRGQLAALIRALLSEEAARTKRLAALEKNPLFGL